MTYTSAQLVLLLHKKKGRIFPTLVKVCAKETQLERKETFNIQYVYLTATDWTR